MSSPPVAETIETHGCSIVLRRVEGPVARELFLACEPRTAADAGPQAEAAYRAILGVLEAEGGGFGSVVSETLFLRSVRADLEPARAARRRVLAASPDRAHLPAITEIEQPPLHDPARLAISLQAVLPHRPPLRVDTFDARPACACAACAGSRALRVRVGEEARLYASGLHGRGADAYEETLALFAAAEDLLQQAGMDFRDVARTWIHLRDMDRDYAALNRGRRAFFAARGIDPAPASTAVGGGPVAEGHDLCLAVYAVRTSGARVARTAMHAPTLNEAPAYGSDFSRGIRTVEANRIALHVSGTASIDEAGRTAHPEDFDAQVDRMLVNLAALLAGQSAGFGDVVSAITYLKRPADAPRLREKLRAAGFVGFPNVLVAAPICRPELLCEAEALAVLPKDRSQDASRSRGRRHDTRRAPGAVSSG